MSIWHQQLMCYYRNSSTGSSPYYKETKTSPGICMFTNVLKLINCSNVFFFLIWIGCKSVINSLTYKDELLAKFSFLAREDIGAL